MASERVVEIPIGWDFVKRYRGKEILEVGNVLQHYYSTKHDVLDKYEKGKGVINEDVISFCPKKKYDLIISLSTMEHVGWSYGEKREPAKFSRGVSNLKKYLKKGGKLVMTFPLFYNPHITDLILHGKMPVTEEYFMKRVSFLNDWVQVGKEEAVKGDKYDSNFANSNILCVVIYTH